MKQALAEARGSLLQIVSDKQNGTYANQKVLQPMELVCGVFWPMLLFAYIFRINLLQFRHHQPFYCFLISTLVPILVNAYFSFKYYRALRNGAPLRRWKVIMNLVTWGVIFYAALEAEKTYWSFAKGYYDFQSMASYINLDPNADRGQTYMDAGQVYFKEGTKVEVSKAIAFQEDVIYCVAPIVQQTMDSGGDKSGKSLSGNSLKMPQSGTVDFWAVGINCCDPSGLNFKCGQSGNFLARAGVRELRDDTRPFFLMAVQEWTAWLKMPAKHPLFFHWVQDPLVEVDNLWLNAMSRFLLDGVKALFGVVGGTLTLQIVLYNLGI